MNLGKVNHSIFMRNTQFFRQEQCQDCVIGDLRLSVMPMTNVRRLFSQKPLKMEIEDAGRYDRAERCVTVVAVPKRARSEVSGVEMQIFGYGKSRDFETKLAKYHRMSRGGVQRTPPPPTFRFRPSFSVKFREKLRIKTLRNMRTA